MALEAPTNARRQVRAGSLECRPTRRAARHVVLHAYLPPILPKEQSLHQTRGDSNPGRFNAVAEIVGDYLAFGTSAHSPRPHIAG